MNIRYCTRHPCPVCSFPHYPPPITDDECMCGHIYLSHDNQGGRRKRAPCTVWVNLDTDPVQCTCEDFHP